MSLMVDVPTILPVGVLGHVVAHLLCRSVTLGDGLQFALGRQDLERGKSSFVRCGVLHGMRVDDPGLFFKVERVFLGEQASLGDLIHVFLLIL